ncbi:MAG: hypothetical protein K2J48_04415, partial [Muribaculaceae bacterium]|nr:hypothetical protein [Muribaculaceae bacterium]
MKNFIFRSSLGILVMASLLSSCSNEEEVDYPKPKPAEEPFVLKDRQDIALNSTQKEGVAMQNDFAFRLFNAEVASTNKNSLISPLSIAQCVSMAANGAAEEVKNEIVGNLIPNGGSIADLNNLNKYLSEALADVDNSSMLTLSNSVWVHNKYSWLSPFSNAIKEYYNAESGVLDMYSQSAADRINSWINSTTNGLIPSLYDKAPGSDIVLINTMYFKGEWTTPFREETTEKALFANEDGKSPEVDFMNSYNTQRMVSINSDCSIAQLNYGNKAFSLYALLPAEGTKFTLNAEKWNEIKENMEKQDVDISLPKFEVEYMVEEMENKMMQAGMKELFTSGGAFLNTVSPKLDGSKVAMRHKTVFKVNEKGAEGAALTEIGAVTFGPGETVAKRPSIIFNRPFIYIVEEQSTGAILFIGAVRNLGK